MRWQGRRESDNVEDRRDQSSGSLGGGRQIRLPRGKGGIVLLIVVAIAGYYGYDLTALLTGGEVAPTSQQQQRSVSANDDEAAKFTKVILATTEDTWGKLFQQMNKQYVAPKLVMYRGATRTGCGTGQSVMGPFYCPADQTVYIDLSFYDEMKPNSARTVTSPRATSSRMKLATMSRNYWVLNRKCVKCSRVPARRRSISSPSKWNCRRTVLPVSGDTICSRKTSLKRAICRKR